MTENSSYLSRITIPQPFASGTGVPVTTIGTTSSPNMNVVDGFPLSYSQVVGSGGKYVTRGDMNALGRLATQNEFYYQAGGLNTFDQEFAEAIGGYPKYAVLDWLVGNKLFKVMSLKDNNKIDFTGNAIKSGITTISQGKVDNENWTYLNMPEPDGEDIVVGKLPSRFGPNTCQYVAVFIAPKSGYLSFSGTYSTYAWISNISSTSNIPPQMWYGCGLLAKEIGNESVSLPSIDIVADGSNNKAEYNSNGWTPVFPFTSYGCMYGTAPGTLSVKCLTTNMFHVDTGKKYAICSICGIPEGETESATGITLAGDLTKSVAYDIDMNICIS